MVFRSIPKNRDGADMISERSFAASFSSFWTEFFPMLTPSFVSMVNDGYKKNLRDECGVPLNPIPKNPYIKDASVVSEFAFYLVKISLNKKSNIEKIFSNEKLRKQAECMALKIISQYEGNSEYRRRPMTKIELDEGRKLALNYQNFLEGRGKGRSIEFSPIVPGAGFLSQCKADLSIGDTLFEVKTVNRNLAGKDVKQLIVYLALQSATGNRRWSKAGFLNPRKAVYHEFFVDDIVYRMSGKSAIEVFQDLISYVCTHDVQIDIAF